MPRDEPPFNCVNCGEPLVWSMDFRRWVHDRTRTRFCPSRFDEDNNPTTMAQVPDA